MDREELGFADLAPPFAVKLAAALHGVTGLYVGLSAVQLLISVVFFGPLELMQYLNWALVVLGALHVGIAARMIRMRSPWGAVGLLAALFSAGLVTGWVVASVSFAIFSCMQLGALALAWATLLAAPFALGPITRADAARKKLEEGGMGLGL
jgi:hypothetical protein